MKEIEFFAIKSRVASDGLAYLWAPIHSSGSNSGYLVIHGELSSSSFEALEKNGLGELFFKSLANSSEKPTFWITEAKHKTLTSEIQRKVEKGYKSYGFYKGKACILDMVNGDDNRVPFDPLYADQFFSEGFMQAIFRVPLATMMPILTVKASLNPVWG